MDDSTALALSTLLTALFLAAFVQVTGASFAKDIFHIVLLAAATVAFLFLGIQYVGRL